MVVLRKFEAGIEVPAHTHPLANEWAYVLSGEWEESDTVYTEGTLFTPKGERHGPPYCPHRSPQSHPLRRPADCEYSLALKPTKTRTCLELGCVPFFPPMRRTLVLLFTLFGCLAKRRRLERPNILWIYLEDVSGWFSCYGDQVIETPNIDQLAESGVSLDRFYTPAGVCSATRSAIITGRCNEPWHPQSPKRSCCVSR